MITAGLLSSYVEDERVKLLVGLPVKWPLFVYPKLILLPLPTLLIYVTVCNTFVYGGLSYVALWWCTARKKPEIPPPSPPSFV
jgi:hypothetical protein